MMFILRSAAGAPDATAIPIKAVRRTPPVLAGAAGKTDYFCVADPETLTALRAEGREVIELRDGWYEDDAGGGIAIFGHGKYWEVRDTPFTVVEAVRPAAPYAAADDTAAADRIDVRGAVFGV